MNASFPPVALNTVLFLTTNDVTFSEPRSNVTTDVCFAVFGLPLSTKLEQVKELYPDAKQIFFGSDERAKNSR